MGTNYYAKIIPSKERKKELHDAIDNNDVARIEKLVHELYGPIYMEWSDNEIKGGSIHLGKRSSGWKFLWNPNIFMIRNGHTEWEDLGNGCKRSRWITEPSTSKYVYPLTKEGIKAFIDRVDVEIYDEYDELQDKEDFFKEALEWGKDDWDSDAYYKKFPNESVLCHENEYTDFLESLGYKLSMSKSDFYSDGLRFSTSTEFC